MILVGTRPEIIKMAPVVRAFKRRGMPFTLVHSGQHYDYEMSERFFEDLELPSPDINLKIRASTPAAQTAEVMMGVEGIIGEMRPRALLVQGDTNTTLGGGLAAVKSGVPVAHVEAGLRSNDFRMQEEYNRRVVDHISSYLFAPTNASKRILQAESVWGRVFVTGNTVIDACVQHAPMAAKRSKITRTLRFSEFALATVHRAENVDDPEVLRNIAEAMMGAPVPVVMPVHPRTRKRLEEYGLWGPFSTNDNVQALPPVGYLDFLSLMMSSALIMTDSGGVVEEATAPSMRKRVLVLRPSTERPEAVRAGFAKVVGTDRRAIIAEIERALKEKRALPRSSPYGNGDAAERIAKVLGSKNVLGG